MNWASDRAKSIYVAALLVITLLVIAARINDLSAHGYTDWHWAPFPPATQDCVRFIDKSTLYLCKPLPTATP